MDKKIMIISAAIVVATCCYFVYENEKTKQKNRRDLEYENASAEARLEYEIESADLEKELFINEMYWAKYDGDSVKMHRAYYADSIGMSAVEKENYINKK